MSIEAAVGVKGALALFSGKKILMFLPFLLGMTQTAQGKVMFDLASVKDKVAVIVLTSLLSAVFAYAWAGLHSTEKMQEFTETVTKEVRASVGRIETKITETTHAIELHRQDSKSMLLANKEDHARYDRKLEQVDKEIKELRSPYGMSGMSGMNGMSGMSGPTLRNWNGGK